MGNRSSKQTTTFYNTPPVQPFEIQISKEALEALFPESNPQKTNDNNPTSAAQHKLHLEKRTADLVRKDTEYLLKKYVQTFPTRLDEEVKGKEDTLLKCYVEKTGRVLDCWRELDEFRRIVQIRKGQVYSK